LSQSRADSARIFVIIASSAVAISCSAEPDGGAEFCMGFRLSAGPDIFPRGQEMRIPILGGVIDERDGLVLPD
jgi:hypothetical protein